MMRLLGWLFRSKPKRLELRCLTYEAADQLIRETQGAWTIAPEEDSNKVPRMVWLELLEKP